MFIFLLVPTLGVGGPPGPGAGVAAVGGGPGVRTYRDNGVKHSTSSYNRVCLQSSIALSFADLWLSSLHILYNKNSGYLSQPTYLTPDLKIKFSN